MEEKKTRSWLIPAVIAVAVVALIAAGAWFFTRPAIPDPYAAAQEALNGAPALPDPATLGVLGQGEVDGVRFGVSGNLNLQADDRDLALSLTDFTLGYEEGSTDLELVLNQDAAAFRLPETTQTWYGVDLLEGLKAQAGKVVDEALVDWYFTPEALAEAEGAVGELRTALEGVRDLGFDSERADFLALLAHAPATAEQVDGGFVLTFDKIAESDTVSSPVVLRLDGQRRLTALEFGLSSGGHFLLDLGDAAEPSPRLELTWGDGGANSLELAFTVSEGTAVELPEFENAFSLLKQLAGE